MKKKIDFTPIGILYETITSMLNILQFRCPRNSGCSGEKLFGMKYPGGLRWSCLFDLFL